MKQSSTVLKLLLVVLCTAALTSCARNMHSNTYVEGSTPGKVLEGKIINIRTVQIKAHDKLQDNSAGALGGGAAGALAGSQVGHGNGSLAAGIGGALVGAVGGAFLQDALSTQDGSEYLVKIDKKYLQEYDGIRKKVAVGSKTSVEQDMALSASVGTKSDIISVVQAPDPDLAVGSHVYIIYNDDRPRLVSQK